MVHEARNPELEALIERDSERDEPYRVYGDWLLQRRHPLGKVIALQLAAEQDPAVRAAAEAATREYVATCCGWAAHSVTHQLGPVRASVAPGSAVPPVQRTLGWQRGLIRKARLLLDDGHRLPEALRLLADPAARLLNELQLGRCELDQRGVSALGALPALRRLTLHQVRLPRPLEIDDLPSIESLSLTSIDREVQLSGGAHLQRLRLASTAVADLAPLAAMSVLRTLELCALDEPLSERDLSSLVALARLRSLGLAGNQLTDIAPLAALTGLVSLDLGGADDRVNQISDLEPVRGLQQLEILVLDHNPIRDLAPLSGLAALRELHLAHSAVTDLRPLHRLRELEFLSLEQTAVPAEQLAALQDARPDLEVLLDSPQDLPLDVAALLATADLPATAGAPRSGSASARAAGGLPSLDEALTKLVTTLLDSGQLELTDPAPAPAALVAELLEAAAEAENDARMVELLTAALLESELVDELYCADEELIALLGRCLDPTG